MTNYSDWLQILENTEPRSAKLADRALEKLSKERMAPTPENYALWYTYFAGYQPDLNRVIDQMVKNGQPFTPLRCEDLVKRFFRFDAEAYAVRSAGDRTQEAISKVLKTIKTTLSDTGRTQGVVENLQSTLDQPVTMDRLRTIVAGVVVEVRTMVTEQEQLRQQLDQASNELVTLRANLDTVRRQAETDALTGIANRRAFDQALKQAVAGAVRDRVPLALLLIDIDHFKKFNDSYGHSLGDQVLKVVARLLAQTTEERGTPARYGGEEFAIVLPRSTLAEAMAVAETIRTTIASKQIASRDGSQNYGTITLSVGVAQYIVNESVGSLIDRADGALYKAKSAGRNRVHVAD